MPNHVSADLWVKGKSGVKAFVEFIRTAKKGKDTGTDFDCDKIIPYPEEYRTLDAASHAYEDKQKEAHKTLKTLADREAWYKENPRPSDGYNSGGYEWCIAHWGTKWGVYDVKLEQTKGKEDKAAFYTFNSAWSAPMPVILACSEKFPDLTFTLKYYEQGMGFKGVYECKGGEVVRNDTAEYRGHRGG